MHNFLNKKGLAIVLALVALFAGGLPAQASFNNGGFETGNFTGWSTLGETLVVGPGTFGTQTINPDAGSFHARLRTFGDHIVPVNDIASFLGVSAAAIHALNGTIPADDAQDGSAIKQQITVAAGTVITFRWNFATQDYGGFNDFAFVSIVPGPNGLLSSVALLGNTQGNTNQTGYQTYTHTFTTAGTYTVGVGVLNSIDNGVESRLYVDNFVAHAPVVPAPPAVVLAGLGLAGLLGYSRLRRRQAA